MTNDAFTIAAPVRINLIDDPTDNSRGFVLPIAIERGAPLRWISLTLNLSSPEQPHYLVASDQTVPSPSGNFSSVSLISAAVNSDHHLPMPSSMMERRRHAIQLKRRLLNRS